MAFMGFADPHRSVEMDTSPEIKILVGVPKQKLAIQY